MPRQKKDSHPVTVRMKAELYDRLGEFCKNSGQPKTVAIERALERYIDDYDNDMEMLKTKNDN